MVNLKIATRDKKTLKMKNIQIIIFISCIVLFFLLAIKKDLIFYFPKDSSKEKTIKESTRILSECIDSKNKSKRSYSKSIELIEYCLKEYGYKK